MDIRRVTIQLPEDISTALEEQWDDAPRRSLEAIAVERYRTGALTGSQARRLLGLDTRFQVHAAVHERRQRKVLTPNDFATLTTLEHYLMAFQHRYQMAARPFRWTFTRADLQQLLAKLATAAESVRPAA